MQFIKIYHHINVYIQNVENHLEQDIDYMFMNYLIKELNLFHVCKKSFAEKGTLKVHMQSHSNINNFKCTLCNFSCKTDSHLREHYKYKHHQTK